MSARLTVEIPRSYWLTANRTITNHGHRRAIITALHDITTLSARAQRLPAIATPCAVTWTIHYPRGVGDVADPVNAAPTTKALMDALVPRWVARDDSRHIVRETFQRGPNLPGKGHLVVATFETADTIKEGTT